METPVGTKDYAPRGTEHARPASAIRRRARPGRFWRSALMALAIAVAVLALLATRARAEPGGSAPTRAVRVQLGNLEPVQHVPVTFGVRF